VEFTCEVTADFRKGPQAARTLCDLQLRQLWASYFLLLAGELSLENTDASFPNFTKKQAIQCAAITIHINTNYVQWKSKEILANPQVRGKRRTVNEGTTKFRILKHDKKNKGSLLHKFTQYNKFSNFYSITCEKDPCFK
jgi:hypothetical protein